MNSEHIFSLALGINTPWEIKKVQFDNEQNIKVLHIEIGFKKGTKFPDKTGQLCPIHDTKNKTWRHLNFFEHQCYLHCKVPRIKTSTGKVELIETPWSRSDSGFTLLFEAYVMALIESEMPVNKIGELLQENTHRLWTIFNYWIECSYASDEVAPVKCLGIDETSSKKGHKYVTLGVDLDERRVIHVTEGKGKETISEINQYMQTKGVEPDEVAHASIDLSPSFISGIKENFPNAQIHFDRFHVVKLLNEAIDEVRRLERKEHKELKGHKYTFLKNKDKLSDKKRKELGELITLFPTLGRAYRLKELFNDIWEQETVEDAEILLENWCNEVESEGIGPFMKFVKTVKAHKAGIINFCEHKINNGILEGINSKIQLAKRRARGFRRTKNFINMIYFLCSKLKFDYPHYST